MNPKDVNAHQIGGEHYRSELQHWDFVELNGIGYLEGCATKYLTRWRKKGGLLDLKKAKHYIEKLMSLPDRKDRTYDKLKVDVQDFCKANNVAETEARVIDLLVCWEDRGQLVLALGWIDIIIEREELRLLREQPQAAPARGD